MWSVLGRGEPDFDTPEHIKEACKKALDEGFTKYTPTPGLPSFREAIQEKFVRDNGLHFETDQIVAGTGGKQIIYNFLMSTINKGDEVLFPAPYWVSYYDMVTLAEGVPRVLPTNHHSHFKILPEELEKMISPKTKVFIMNSPSNPTGVVYTREELLAIAQVLEKHPRGNGTHR